MTTVLFGFPSPIITPVVTWAAPTRVYRSAEFGVISLNFNVMGRVDFPGIPTGRVAGTVKEHASPSNLPRNRMVYLHRQRDGRRVGAVASDPVTGAYEFRDIDTREQYFVISFDHTLNYNAVIRSDVTPEVIA